MKIKRILKWTALTILIVLVVFIFIAYWTSSNDCNRYSLVPTNPMKAILSCEYGAENLHLRDIEKPTPADNEVLVRVRAASVNPVDGHMIRGSWLGRAMSGLRKPKNTRFGTDFAGVVEAVGKDVTDFKSGDEVFGAKNGAVDEFICVKADRAVVTKPSNTTFEQAGSDVTAVCSTRNVDLVKSIGADRVIDYTKEDFTRADQRYDVIYDLVGNHS